MATINKDFVHLHTHSDASFDDSILTIDKILNNTISNGLRSVAITDHNSLANAKEFIEKAVIKGIKPIVGCEFYFVEDAQKSIDTMDTERFHILLIAKNTEGLLQLIKLSNECWFNNLFISKHKLARSLLDIKQLEKYNDNIIVTTACYYGIIPYMLLNDNVGKAQHYTEKLLELFGDDLYFEIADHNIAEEKIAFDRLIKFSKRYNIKTVVAQDAHYPEKYDGITHEVLISTRFGYRSNFSFPNYEYYLKTPEQMYDLSPVEYCKNTLEIADKVENYDIDSFKMSSGTEHGIKVHGSTIRTISLKDSLRRTDIYFKLPNRLKERINEICSVVSDPFELRNDNSINKYFTDNEVVFNTLNDIYGLKSSFDIDGAVYNVGSQHFNLPIMYDNGKYVLQWDV